MLRSWFILVNNNEWQKVTKNKWHSTHLNELDKAGMQRRWIEGGAKMLVFNFRISPDEIWNWPLYTEGKEKPKKEASLSRLVGGRLINKETYIYDWSWVTARYLNLKVHTEALTGFTHICHPDGLSNTLSSQGCVLEKLLVWECSVKHTYIPRTGIGMRSLQLPRSSLWVNWRSRPLCHLLQQSHYLSAREEA